MCVTWETRKATRLSCIDPVEVGLGRRGRAPAESYPSSGRNFKDSSRPALTTHFRKRCSFLLKKFSWKLIEIIEIYEERDKEEGDR